MKRTSLLAGSLVLLVTGACSSLIVYETSEYKLKSLSVATAKTKLTAAIASLTQRRVNNIEVTEQYLKIVYNGVRIDQLYYANVGRMQIFIFEQRAYYVDIFDQAGRLVLRVWPHSLQSAKDIVDSITYFKRRLFPALER